MSLWPLELIVVGDEETRGNGRAQPVAAQLYSFSQRQRPHRDKKLKEMANQVEK